MAVAASLRFLFTVCCVIVVFIVVLIPCSEQLQSSHAHTLLRIKWLLNSPAVLSTWNITTDFCNTEPSASLTVVCYEDSITQLHIIGGKGTPALPRNFSIDSFFTTLVRLPSLKVLSLVSLGLWGSLPTKISRLLSLEILNVSSNFLYGEIPREVSAMRGLQTVILDDNKFTGGVPSWISELSLLSVLSLRNNSFGGTLPTSLRSLETLRILSLSLNQLTGEVPDLSSLTNLQVLDLEDNKFGPGFPRVANKLVTLVLKKNKFGSAIPEELGSYYQLKWIDISFNKFVGPFPRSLLTLPSVTYLNIAGNRFTGMLFKNMSCNAELDYVDFSSNLLTGKMPTCLLSDSKDRVVRYANNCLTTREENQHPYFFCRNEAFAVGILPHKQKKSRASKTVLAFSIVGGICLGVVLVGLIFVLFRRIKSKKMMKVPRMRLIKENVSTGYPSKLLSDARYISQTMRLGALGLPSYRTFALEELEQATNNFDSSSFLGEGSHGQMYRGQLNDGSFVAIRCLKLKKKYSTQNFTHHIELISKLRHQHLVSALGHCFECYLDDSSVSRMFLVFEYVQNGTLRAHISAEGSIEQTLNWTQRITAAIGVAKGIQFLHTGIVPGVFSNNLKITDILLDNNLVAKISSYNLPLLAENMGKVGTKIYSSGVKENNTSGRTIPGDKVDVYDFGVILLELVVGRPILTENEVDFMRGQLVSIMTDDANHANIIDPVICKVSSEESLKTVIGICFRALSKEPTERPSVEDVLWNLQFAAQVQDEWRGDSQSQSCKESPVSPSHHPSMQLTFQ